MNRIINCTSKLKLDLNQKKIIETVSGDLKTIKKAIPEIDEIIVRGGFTPDILLGKEPQDIDIFYCVKNKNGEYSVQCRCNKIRNKIDKLKLEYVGNKYTYDLENSFEKEPRLKPVERTAGFFSYHVDWLSMFCLNSNGNILTNKTTLNFFEKRIHEIRYEGFLPWAYYPKPTDGNNYYAALAYEMVRGLTHIQRRELKMGKLYSELVENAEFILKGLSQTKEKEGIKTYIKHKFGNLETFVKSTRKLNLKNQLEIEKGFKLLFNKHQSD
jgi:hypothetical protein